MLWGSAYYVCQGGQQKGNVHCLVNIAEAQVIKLDGSVKVYRNLQQL